jgi:hypothetical protein
VVSEGENGPWSKLVGAFVHHKANGLLLALVDAPFVGIDTVRMKDVNLAKRLVRVNAHAVVVLCVHDLLREGAILLHCACLAK